MNREHDPSGDTPDCQLAEETPRKRILFIDDDQSIPPVLAKHGFDVTRVGTLEEALKEMQAEKFDILIFGVNE